MRRAILTAVLFSAGCATSAPTSTPADWAMLADALSSEEYAETFLDDLATRLDAAYAVLSDRQRDAVVYGALVEGAEAQRTVLDRRRDAGPDQAANVAEELRAGSVRTDAAVEAVEAVLTPDQAPVYRGLQREARTALAREAEGS